MTDDYGHDEAMRDLHVLDGYVCGVPTAPDSPEHTRLAAYIERLEDAANLRTDRDKWERVARVLADKCHDQHAEWCDEMRDGTPDSGPAFLAWAEKEAEK